MGAVIERRAVLIYEVGSRQPCRPRPLRVPRCAVGWARPGKLIAKIVRMGADHNHSAGMRHRGRLVVTLCLSASIVVVQFVGAFWSGSLALLADSVHVFADALGVGLALVAVTVANRPTKARRTFGLFRLEILATAANGILLLGLSVFIVVEAVRRWMNPTAIEPGIMIAAAGYGLIANAVGVLLLRGGSGKSLTVRSAYLEVVADAAGSAGVMIAGMVVLVTGWTRSDVIVSFAIALFIIPRTLMLLRDAFSVLMENAPRGLDLDEVRQHMCDVPGVAAVHDLHAWTITSGMMSLSAHVSVEPSPYFDGNGEAALTALAECLRECFAIEHTTFQLESVDHPTDEPLRHP